MAENTNSIFPLSGKRSSAKEIVFQQIWKAELKNQDDFCPIPAAPMAESHSPPTPWHPQKFPLPGKLSISPETGKNFVRRSIYGRVQEESEENKQQVPLCPPLPHPCRRHLTFAGVVQILLPKHEPIALNSACVKLQAKNDIAGGRPVLLVVALHLDGGENRRLQGSLCRTLDPNTQGTSTAVAGCTQATYCSCWPLGVQTHSPGPSDGQ